MIRALALLLACAPALVLAATDREALAASTCAALDDSVQALPPGPVLLASYPPLDGQQPDIEALRNVAFTYDNALTSIALFGCGKPASALRIADALAQAVNDDPEVDDGRVRNAYAAGSVGLGKMKLAGYWSPQRNAWSQDAYQVSTATGNQAWAALALLEAYRNTHSDAYLHAARRALQWTADHALSANAPDGFIGGVFGYWPNQSPQTWKSTEHNIDLAAAWSALDRLQPDPEAARQAQRARDFVAHQWDAEQGRFLIGTASDGRTQDRERSGLDSQVWPLIALADPDADWQRVFAYIDRAHRSGEGYGFDRHPNGLWTEGTAQVAAVAQAQGRLSLADALWPVLRQQDAGNGWLYATPQARIETGLAIGPTSTHNDFFYYHLPHLGATAWAALAATGRNPFTGAGD